MGLRGGDEAHEIAVHASNLLCAERTISPCKGFVSLRINLLCRSTGTAKEGIGGLASVGASSYRWMQSAKRSSGLPTTRLGCVRRAFMGGLREPSSSSSAWKDGFWWVSSLTK